MTLYRVSLPVYPAVGEVQEREGGREEHVS